MKRAILVVLIIIGSVCMNIAAAQCSICTRTAEQMGEKSAGGLNAGIIYLALTPLAIIGFIGYRWFKRTD
jgi:hypothetical protein